MLTSNLLVFILLWLSATQLLDVDSSYVKTKSNNNEHQACRKGAADLAFVIDESPSIDKADFNRTMLFLANLTSSLEIGPDKNQSQVALVKFASSATLVFNLKRHSTKQKLYSAIIATPQVNEGTNIASGMNLAISQVFTTSAGDRSDIQNIMLVLTDGQDSSDVINAYKAAATKNITIYAIGVGNAVNRSQLEAIVGGNSAHVYNVFDFNALDSLNTEICIGILESAGFPWLTVSMLIFLPLAFLVFAAICLPMVFRTKRLSRAKTLAATNASVIEMSLLTRNKEPKDDEKTSAALLPKRQPPKPPSADKKWNAFLLNDGMRGSIGEPKTDASRSAAKLPCPDSAGDSGLAVEKHHALLPPIAGKSRIADPMCNPSSSKDGDIKTAERQQVLSSPTTKMLSPNAEDTQEANRFYDDGSNAERETKLMKSKRPILPPAPPPPDVEKSQTAAIFYSETPTSEVSRKADRLCTSHDPHSGADDKTAEGKQTIMPSRPIEQLENQISEDQLDVSKKAVTIRKERPTALESKKVLRSQSTKGRESTDHSKSVSKIRHKQGSVPSVFLESSASYGAEGEPKVAKIVRRPSASFRIPDVDGRVKEMIAQFQK
uniref:VWFA domain-containing protein n=1 Tax=Plectus sambesii TaxID=2011161 RepID=A0A914XRM7_9BILA